MPEKSHPLHKELRLVVCKVCGRFRYDGFSTGGFSTGGFSTGGFSTGGFSTGEFLKGGFSTSGFSTGGFSTSGFSTGGFSKDGSSTEATDLLMASWRPGTQNQYDRYVERWKLYAGKHGTDDISPSV